MNYGMLLLLFSVLTVVFVVGVAVFGAATSEFSQLRVVTEVAIFFQTALHPNSIDWLWRMSKARAEADYFVVAEKYAEANLIVVKSNFVKSSFVPKSAAKRGS